MSPDMTDDITPRCRRSIPAAFGDAFRGLAVLWRTQRHARFQCVAATGVLVAARVLDVPRQDWGLLLLCIGLVLTAEALNTAVEFLADAVHPKQHPLIGQAKDVAAGSVLLAAATAVVVGLLVFIPALTASMAEV